MQSTITSSNPPPGGNNGTWRYRLLHFHVPIALASAFMLIVFMTLPAFEPRGYPMMDMSSSAALPQEPNRVGMSGMAGHGGGQTPMTGHSGNQTPSAGHSQNQSGHSGSQTGHSGNQTGHSGGQMLPMDSNGMMQDSGGSSFAQRFTFSTGYVALIFLGITLLIGPANLLLRRRMPVSSYLRRDVGMWTAGFSVVHVFFGLQAHSGGQPDLMLRYFVSPNGSLLTSSFGLANWTGLAATVIVVGLLTISSNFALRKLKAGPWKWLQRLNYALFALVILHAFFYGALLRATSPYTLLLGLTVIMIFVGQVVGMLLWRCKHGHTVARFEQLTTRE